MDATPKVIWGWWSMKMTVQFSGVSRLWIRSLAGMVVSSCNGVLESMETQDERVWGQPARGAGRVVVVTVSCGRAGWTHSSARWEILDDSRKPQPLRTGSGDSAAPFRSRPNSRASRESRPGPINRRAAAMARYPRADSNEGPPG